MNRTSIEWCDFSWSPVTGCLGPDGEGPCPYCYAVAISKRFRRSFEPQLHVDRLKEPSKLKTGSKIFVCSMADLFGDWVPYGWVEKVLQVIQETPRHLYFLLTKYPQNLVSFQFPHRAWVGITIDKQERVTGIEHLKQVTAVRFISFEPLLEPIKADLYGIDWIIIGGCTGPQRFMPPKKWVDSLIAEARKCGVAVFLKDNLGYPEVIQEWPEGPPCYHDEHDQPCSDYCPDTYQSCPIIDLDKCKIIQDIERAEFDPNEQSEPEEHNLLKWCKK